MSNDALERLKKKKRPSVPHRDSSLQSSSLDISKLEKDLAPPSLKQQELLKDEKIASRNLGIQTSTFQVEPLQTKQTTLRLEVEISDRLSKVCQDNKIGREVLLEALLEYYEKDDRVWEKILTEAKKKADLRMQFANFKRARSMMQYLTSPSQ